MRILYVEDNPNDADLLMRKIERQRPDVKVDIARSLEGAWEMINKGEKHQLALVRYALT